jgi:hypothetical protein
VKCSSCGANYDDKFAFCPYCGTAKPQPPTVRVLVEEPKYEYCQVDWIVLKQGGFFSVCADSVYEARGTGANASKVYARSRVYRTHPNDFKGARHLEEMELSQAVRIELIGELERQGWQEHDPEKYIYRRRVV